MQKVLSRSIISTTIMYAMVGMMGYLTFVDNTD